MAKGIGRNGELFRTLCDPAHLMRCARAAARGKKRKPDAAAFLLNLEPECFRLADELAAGTWMPGTYRSYVIREPKPRIHDDGDRDKWLNAQEMLEYGLIDKVLDRLPGK